MTIPDGALEYELAIQRGVTEAFIEAEPVSIALRTRGRVRTPSGAYATSEGPARAPQTFKVIMVSPAGASIEQSGGDGTERRVDYVLLGTYDAQVGIGDFWEEGATRYEVSSVIPYNGYEVRANVRAYGTDPQNG